MQKPDFSWIQMLIFYLLGQNILLESLYQDHFTLTLIILQSIMQVWNTSSLIHNLIIS